MVWCEDLSDIHLRLASTVDGPVVLHSSLRLATRMAFQYGPAPSRGYVSFRDACRRDYRDREDSREKMNERQPNQALQTTPMTRSVYEKNIEFGDPQRGV